MGQTRREFLKSTTAAATMAGIAAHPFGRHATDALVSPSYSPYSPLVAAEPNVKELAMIALDAAKHAGAEYADVRFVRNRNQNVTTREQRVSNVSDNETYGFGVRSLVNGCWGFAASRDLTRDEAARVATHAVAQASWCRRSKCVSSTSRARVTLFDRRCRSSTRTSHGSAEPCVAAVEAPGA